MEFRILGPVQAIHDGTPVDLGQPQARLVLGLLLLEPNRVVPVHRLIDVVWRGVPPPTARAGLHNRIAALRHRLVAGEAAIVTRPTGYQLEIDPLRIDAHVFVEAVQRGRTALDAATRAKLLDDALRLWRGPLMADVVDESTTTLGATLAELRLVAYEAHAQAMVDIGEHDQVIDRLFALAAEFQTRERLIGTLMVALARAGRLSEALDLYHNTWRRLDAELGIRPGRDLIELHERLLLGNAAAARYGTPAEPVETAGPPQTADSQDFVGRDAELAALDDVARVPPRHTPKVVVLTGAAGAGKTTLALWWAQRYAQSDAIVVCDLGGFSGTGSATAAAVMTQALSRMGVAAERVPVEPVELRRAYERELALCRPLLILDDAYDADQVRSVMPDGAGVIVLVTSRRWLRDLADGDGAVTVEVPPLPDGASLALLRGLLTDHLDGSPASFGLLSELAELCGRVPLALHVAAASINHERLSLTDYVRTLGGGDQPGVKNALRLSYMDLPAAAQRCLRAFAIAPLRHLTPDSAAALLATTADEALVLLDKLADLHLVHLDGGGYRPHDLVRQYAVERAAEHPEPVALERLYAFYGTSITAAASMACSADEPAWPAQLAQGASGLRFDDAPSAMAWLDAELPNLVALAAYAADYGPGAFSWELARRMMRYFWMSRRGHEWYAICESGLRAARGADDPTGIAQSLNGIGIAHWANNRLLEAIACLDEALHRNRALGRVDGQNSNLGNLAALNRSIGRLVEASRYARESVALARSRGDVRREANATLTLTGLSRELGRLREGIRHGERALDLYSSEKVVDGQASVLHELSLIGYLCGDTDAAIAHGEESLRMATQAGSLGNLVDARVALTWAYIQAGWPDDAATVCEEAHRLAEQSGDLYLIAPVLMGAAAVAWHLGDPAAAYEQAAAAVSLARSQRHRYVEAEALVLQAHIQVHGGAWSMASALAAEARAVAGEAGLRLLEAMAQTVAAEALADSGDLQGAGLTAKPTLAFLERAGAVPWAQRCRDVITPARR